MADERDFLHKSDEFSLELLVDEADGEATFVFTTDGSAAWDLTAEDDVVIVFEGTGLPLKVLSSSRATATISLERLDEGGSLMVRVHEFLDGWDF